MGRRVTSVRDHPSEPSRAWTSSVPAASTTNRAGGDSPPLPLAELGTRRPQLRRRRLTSWSEDCTGLPKLRWSRLVTCPSITSMGVALQIVGKQTASAR